MTQIKSYTSLAQSRVLAKILPLESADMEYILEQWIDEKTHRHKEEYCEIPVVKVDDDDCPLQPITHPCWSLAALLGVLPKKYYPVKDHVTDLILGKPKDRWCLLYWDATGMQDGEQTLAENPVDACYKMILKLNEQNLI